MRYLLLGVVVAAGASLPALAQDPHAHHGPRHAPAAKADVGDAPKPGGDASKSGGDAPKSVPATPSAPAKGPPGAFRSPFADYRPFTAGEPAKGWRAANDEVREAGGHIGLMKGGR